MLANSLKRTYRCRDVLTSSSVAHLLAAFEPPLKENRPCLKLKCVHSQVRVVHINVVFFPQFKKTIGTVVEFYAWMCYKNWISDWQSAGVQIFPPVATSGTAAKKKSGALKRSQHSAWLTQCSPVQTRALFSPAGSPVPPPQHGLLLCKSSNGEIFFS